MLDDIGFYTLTERRAATASSSSPLSRCELLVTDRCNFRCPYCRGVGARRGYDLVWDDARRTLDPWIAEGLRNVRFSGGEPTLWPLLADAVRHVRPHVERVAVSTNGTAEWTMYADLLDAGVDDFSVSLDACCAADGGRMAGGGKWERVPENIRRLCAAGCYVTVGTVITDDNMAGVGQIAAFAHSLGVSDIRVIPAAQNGNGEGITLPAYPGHPILAYRAANIAAGRVFRGLAAADSRRCPLVLDDMAVSDGHHYPCIIYLREGGEPIGRLSAFTRSERAVWAQTHDTHTDPICRANCLDVCVAYNNRYHEIHSPGLC